MPRNLKTLWEEVEEDVQVQTHVPEVVQMLMVNLGNAGILLLLGYVNVGRKY